MTTAKVTKENAIFADGFRYGIAKCLGMINEVAAQQNNVGLRLVSDVIFQRGAQEAQSMADAPVNIRARLEKLSKHIVEDTEDGSERGDDTNGGNSGRLGE